MFVLFVCLFCFVCGLGDFFVVVVVFVAVVNTLSHQIFQAII